MHDLRCTGSTILNELVSDSDWIEKCLAHEDGRSSRDVYNKAEYAEQGSDCRPVEEGPISGGHTPDGSTRHD